MAMRSIFRSSARFAYVIAAMASIHTPLHAQETTESIIVTAPGGTIDADDAIQLESDVLTQSGPPSLIGALARNVAGISLSEAQGNPYQPNIIYRGFSASPLQGNAQGLAVYIDGARFNQPFGDTVNLDLLPDLAIDAVSIKDASPVYGLNALGGVIALSTKTGRSAPGLSLFGAGGSDGRGEGGGEFGWSRGGASAYAAFELRRDGGWRKHSPSTLYNGFADLGWDSTNGGVHIKYLGADSDLTGNGTAPVELLAADYRAVFTFPDNTRNRYTRVSLHPWLRVGANSRIEASLYAHWLRQATLNGDAADIEGCVLSPGLVCLDGEDELRDTRGNTIPDLLGGEGYGLLNRSATRTRAQGALVQFVDRRSLLGGENELILGFSHDRSKTHFASSSELGALTQERSVDGLGPVIAQADGSIAPVGLHVDTRYTGLFLANRLPLGSRLSAEIGLRWNRAVVMLDDQLGTALDGNHRFTRLNPGIEFDYAISPSLSLRAGYAETNRAPTPAELSCADEDAPCSLTNFFVGDPPLEQVVAKSWELGASGNANGPWKLEWLLSAYRTTNNNDIQFAASDIRGRAFFRNIGTTRRQGVEASASLSHGPWMIRAGYAFTDATFRSPLTFNSPDNPSADTDGRISVAAGRRIPSVARHRGVFSLEYTADRFALAGDIQAQSGQFLVGDEGNSQPRIRGFALVNLRGSIQVAGPFTLFATVTNLFDKRYATFGTFTQTDEIELEEAPGASDPRSLGPGAPRKWLVGVKARF